MKIKPLIVGVALAGVLALSLGGAVMAADGEGNGTCDDTCDGTCEGTQQQTQQRLCQETCTQSELCEQNCVRTGQADEEEAAVTGDNGENAAGYSYGESGEGTGPGLNRQWGKSAQILVNID